MNRSLIVICVYLLFGNHAIAQDEEQSIFDILREKKLPKQLTFPTPLSKEEAEFKAKYDLELKQYTARYLHEFAEFKEKYNSELAAYRSKILTIWGEVEVSGTDKVVDYSAADVKTVVDFEKQEIVVSIIHDIDQQPNLDKVEKALKNLNKVKPDSRIVKTATKTVNVLAAFTDPTTSEIIVSRTADVINKATKELVIPSIDDEDLKKEVQVLKKQEAQDKQQVEIIAEQADLSEKEVLNIQKGMAVTNKINRVNVNRGTEQNTKNSVKELKQKRITRYRIQVKGKSEQSQIAKVRPYAELHAKEWDLPLELIIAIIHTESSFNPMAVSHIPAYGLMQIVPNSAGIDVNEFLHEKREPMVSDYLFVSEQNIEAGSAYLHILNHRYLRKITNNTSRLYCVIAAYNTGVGNVAKAFSNGNFRRMSNEVVNKINGLSPQEVYDILLNDLPYKETRRYLKKVDTRMSHYKQVIDSNKKDDRI